MKKLTDQDFDLLTPGQALDALINEEKVWYRCKADRNWFLDSIDINEDLYLDSFFTDFVYGRKKAAPINLSKLEFGDKIQCRDGTILVFVHNDLGIVCAESPYTCSAVDRYKNSVYLTPEGKCSIGEEDANDVVRILTRKGEKVDE